MELTYIKIDNMIDYFVKLKEKYEKYLNFVEEVEQEYLQTKNREKQKDLLKRIKMSAKLMIKSGDPTYKVFDDYNSRMALRQTPKETIFVLKSFTKNKISIIQRELDKIRYEIFPEPFFAPKENLQLINIYEEIMKKESEDLEENTQEM